MMRGVRQFIPGLKFVAYLTAERR